MGTIKNPICPYCHTEMISVLYEDNGIFTLVWRCPCDDVKDIEEMYTKINKEG